MISLGKKIKVKKAILLDQFSVNIMFENNEERVIDLEKYLYGPIFEEIQADLTLFRQLAVKNGVISWPNGADIDPDVLYYELKPDRLEQS